MKKLLLLLGLAGALRAGAQATTDTPAELVRAGVALYDEGKYDQAVAKYQQALAAAPGNAPAQAELAMTYFALTRYADAVALCQQILRAHPEADPVVYVTYGNSLDATQRPTEALAAYRDGLTRYPDAFILYFNQGVTLAGQGQAAAAVASFQRAVALNPRHASSHMLLGSTQLQLGQRVLGLLALARFLVLEPNSPRAAARRAQLDAAMLKGVSQQNEHNITVNIAAESLKKKKGKQAADDFGPEEMFLSLAGALTFDEKNKDKTPLEKFIDQFSSLCQVMGEQGTKAGAGFTRTYYVPYFVEMQKKGFVPAFAYLAHSSQADAPTVQQWLAAHPTEVQVFQEWSKSYAWPPPTR